MATRNTLLTSSAGPRVVQFDLPLPVAIFVGLSTYVVASGVALLASVLVWRLLWVVLP